MPLEAMSRTVVCFTAGYLYTDLWCALLPEAMFAKACYRRDAMSEFSPLEQSQEGIVSTSIDVSMGFVCIIMYIIYFMFLLQEMFSLARLSANVLPVTP